MQERNESQKSESLNRRLRPQARPIQWAYLTESQKDAFRRILYMLNEFASGCSERRKGDDQYWLGPDIGAKRSSHVAFLDGVRGAGKSTVFLSLMKHLLSGMTPPYGEPQDRFQKAFANLKGRTIWLKPIDMDPLPSPFGLVPSLVERVNEVFEKHLKRCPLHSRKKNDRSAVEDMRHNIRTLANDATLAWNSNINSRRANLDPDFYGEEMKRTNEARLKLVGNFNATLKEIGEEVAGGKTDPIFIAVIDDLDMQPSGCVEAMRMLRMLALERVFFLLLGDFQILELMSDLNVQNEILGNTNTPGISARELPGALPVIRTATSISRNSLRKLLPANQRIKVSSPLILEGMGHYPDSGDEYQKQNEVLLADLFANVPLNISEDFVVPDKDGNVNVSGNTANSLFDMLMHPGIEVFSSPQPKVNYLRSKRHGDPRIRVSKDNKVLHPQKIFEIHSNGGASDGKRGEIKIEPPGELKPGEEVPKRELGAEFNILDVDRTSSIDRERTDESIKEICFWATQIFANNSRKLNDLWFGLRSLVQRIQRETAKVEPEKEKAIQLSRRVERELLNLLARTCRDYLLEESVFGSSQIERISSSMTPSNIGDFNWSEIPIRFVLISAPPVIFHSGTAWARTRLKVKTDESNKDGKTVVRNLYSQIRAHRIFDWALVAEDDSKFFGVTETQTSHLFDTSKEISPPTAAAVLLLHDVLRLGTQGKRFESNIIPPDDGVLNIREQRGDTWPWGYCQRDICPKTPQRIGGEQEDRDEIWGQKRVWCKWASTRFQGSYRNFQDLYWPPPSVASVWGLDIFRRSWNRTIDHVDLIKKPREKVEALAFGWISAGCSVMSARPPITTENHNVVKPCHWFELFKQLNELASELPEYKSDKTKTKLSSVEQANESWLENVATLVMPELGLPSHLMFRVLFGLDLKKFDVDGETLHETEMDERNRELNGKKYSWYFGQLNEDGGDNERPLVDLFAKRNQVFWKREYIEFDIIVREVKQICEDFGAVIECDDPKMKLEGLFEKFNSLDTDNAWNSLSGRQLCSTLNLTTNNQELRNRLENFFKVVWMRGLPFVAFLNKNATSIRARRGVRLSLLGEIAGGALAVRLYRSSSFHLAAARMRSSIFSDAALKYQFLPEFIEEHSGKKAWKTRMLGDVFTGGGLIPHEDELPEFAKKSGDARWFPECLYQSCYGGNLGAEIGSKRLDINQASVKELMLLDGIGKVMAEKWIEERESNGKYHEIGHLVVRGVINQRQFEKIKNRIRVRRDAI